MSEPTRDEFERELAARRRDLEHEFEDKVRDLKAQQKRTVDRLHEDRKEWDSHRREQQRELADRLEKVRRAEDNHKRDAEALRLARRELENSRDQVRERGQAKVEAKAAQQGAAESRAKYARLANLTAWFSLVAVLGFVVVLGLAFTKSVVALLGAAALGLVLSVLLEWRRRQIGR